MPCICDGPGYCQRHLCHRGPVLWGKCKSGEMCHIFDQAFGVHAIDAAREFLPEVSLADLPSLIFSEASNVNWAVGVCSAPRKRPTSIESVASIKLSGWNDIPIHVFAEPSVEKPYDVKFLQNEERIGAWFNFKRMVESLLATDANAFLLCQDDADFVRAPVREYLEKHVLWPTTRPHVVSLYTSARYTYDPNKHLRPRGWHNIDVTDKIGWWGAVSFAMNRASLEAFVKSPVYQTWSTRKRWKEKPTQQISGIDTALGIWASDQGGIWTPLPSLVQHIGHASSIWSSNISSGPRRANWMLGWSHPIDPPSVGDQIKSAAKATWEFITSGGKITAKTIRRQRLAVCQVCDKRDPVLNKCIPCGCFLDVKTLLPNERCPDDPPRWDRVIVEEIIKHPMPNVGGCNGCKDQPNAVTSSSPATASPE